MTPESPPEQTPPPSRFWKWARRIGCVLTFATFTCCGLTCGGGWLVRNLFRDVNKDVVDRLHAEGMQNGDLKALHAQAHERFRKRYSLENLEAFVAAHPGMLDRANLHGMTVKRQTIDHVEYVKVRNQAGFFSADEWELVFRVDDGVHRLVGISPGLDDLVPESFRYREPPPRHRRHHH